MYINEEYAYDIGWSDGYADRLPNCPFAQGTGGWIDYFEGYEDGCWEE
jgi:hypothetical protein